MHVYHYANYERAALQRLMQKHGTREDEVDDLLRGQVLVDLYQVVRQALRLSLPSYSIKKVEWFYFPRGRPRCSAARSRPSSSSASSRPATSRCSPGSRPTTRTTATRRSASTAGSSTLRPPGLAWRAAADAREPSVEAVEHKNEREQVQAALRDRGRAPARRSARLPPPRSQARLVGLLPPAHARRRRALPRPDAIGRITWDEDEPLREVKSSYVYTLRFPAQEFKVGSDAIDPATESSPARSSRSTRPAA